MPLRTPVATALVATGGAAGAAARWGLVPPAAAGTFPTGTLVVNVLGAGLLGYLVGRVPVRDDRSEAVRLLLGPGVLGGFTTFSAFALQLWRGAPPVYGALSVAGGIGAAVVGLALGAAAAPE